MQPKNHSFIWFWILRFRIRYNVVWSLNKFSTHEKFERRRKRRRRKKNGSRLARSFGPARTHSHFSLLGECRPYDRCLGFLISRPLVIIIENLCTNIYRFIIYFFCLVGGLHEYNFVDLIMCMLTHNWSILYKTIIRKFTS
jgi:hypothetical protein